MKNYVEVAYKETEKPFGEYPLQLAEYLADRYHMKKGMKLLDNGCGRGEFLHAFGSMGMEVHGTDVSSYCKDARIVDLNKENLPYPDNYFDVVFSKSVIEHISNTEHYVNEMKRVLKKGGGTYIISS
jgi:ubiquinone/menaquinone biosynthesis C-methylase UbiE